MDSISLWENIVVPTFIGGMAMLARPGIEDPASPDALAAGAFLMVHASAFRAIGGFEPIRGEMADDVALARLLKSKGYRVGFRFAPEFLHVRIYKGNRHAFWAMTKNVLIAIDGRLWLAPAVMVLPMFAFWTPLYCSLAGLLEADRSLLVTGAAGYIIPYASMWSGRRIFPSHPLKALLLPAGRDSRVLLYGTRPLSVSDARRSRVARPLDPRARNLVRINRRLSVRERTGSPRASGVHPANDPRRFPSGVTRLQGVSIVFRKTTLMAMIAFSILVHAAATSAVAQDRARSRQASSAEYKASEIEGWTVYVKKDFVKGKPALADRTLTLLRSQLFQIGRIVPAAAVKKLRTVKIWVEENDPSTPCMAYHPAAEWLREHHTNPEMAGGIELANARNFLNWTLEQPWMVLHEMSHAYHHKFLPRGFENPELKAAHQNALSSGSYDSVLKIAHTHEKAYALNNPQEYFAEASEAFFGTNDFYPFVRSELKVSDPVGYELMKELWGEKDDRAITDQVPVR